MFFWSRINTCDVQNTLYHLCDKFSTTIGELALWAEHTPPKREWRILFWIEQSVNDDPHNMFRGLSPQGFSHFCKCFVSILCLFSFCINIFRRGDNVMGLLSLYYFLLHAYLILLDIRHYLLLFNNTNIGNCRYAREFTRTILSELKLNQNAPTR